MAKPHEKLARLRRYNTSVQQKDPKLAEESRDIGIETEAAPSPEAVENQIELESIVMRRQRPVLAIRENVTQLVFLDQADSEIWGERLKQAKPRLESRTRWAASISPARSSTGRHRLASPRTSSPTATWLTTLLARARRWMGSPANISGCRLPTGDRESTLRVRWSSRCTSKRHGPDVAFEIEIVPHAKLAAD